MISLYHILFKILLFLPALGIINSIAFDVFPRTQKIINNVVYGIEVLLCGWVLALYTAYGHYTINILTIAKNISITFSINSFNILFAFLMTIIIFFFNISFQSSFKYLNLLTKYPLYNRAVSCLYLIYILLTFSSNLSITILLYLLVFVYSLLFLVNPDLKDFRDKYSVIFVIMATVSSILLIMSAFYLFYNHNISFIIQSSKILKEISIYWLITILFLLIFSVFLLPFYLIFSQKIYYEDHLPLFIIFIIPFCILNIFIFLKITYFIFFNNFSNMGLYFYYSGFFVLVLFFISCFFSLKHIKIKRKFSTLFNVSNFIVFLSQILFVNSGAEIANALSNFVVFSLAITTSILAYASVQYLLFNSNISDTNLFYKHTKIEINYYLAMEFLPILTNFLLFFTLDFHNFNILYFINLLQIFILLCIFGISVYFTIFQPVDKNSKTPLEIPQLEKIKMFLPTISIMFIFLFLFLLKGQIAKFLIKYLV